MMLRHFHQERAVATAEINFEWPAVAAYLRRINFSEVVLRYEFARHRGSRQLVQRLLHGGDL